MDNNITISNQTADLITDLLIKGFLRIFILVHHDDVTDLHQTEPLFFLVLSL